MVADASVNQSDLDKALQERSGMPLKINGLIEESAPTLPVESVAAPETVNPDALVTPETATPDAAAPVAQETDAAASESSADRS